MAQLLMRSPPDAEAPPPSPSPQVRLAQPGDAERLGRLLAAAFPEMSWDAERARRDLLESNEVAATFVIEAGGALVATASCRNNPAFPGAGYVHWVAVDPTRRGGGHFDGVMGAVMHRFDADGLSEVVLETDDPRLPAISAYLRLGFVPQYRDTDHELRWSRVFRQLAESRRTRARPS